MRALVIGNGASILGFNPEQYQSYYDITIGCNHAWQQWPTLDWYCMADERNVLYTREHGPEFWTRCVTRSQYAVKHRLDDPQLDLYQSYPRHLDKRLLQAEGQWMKENRDISGTLGIRWARQLGAEIIDCVGFDSQCTNSWDKAYEDVPWQKRSPVDGNRWRQSWEWAVTAVEPCRVNLIEKHQLLQQNINTIQET